MVPGDLPDKVNQGKGVLTVFSLVQRFPLGGKLVCNLEGCDEKVFNKKRGYCSAHYQKWWKYGDPLFVRFQERPPPKRLPPTKTCSRCKLEKDRTEFPKYYGGRNPERTKSCCKVCANAKKTLRRKVDPITRASKSRQNTEARKRRNGWSGERFAVLMYAQGGLCLICGDSLYKLSHRDHSHVTDAPRGLLCGLCNPGIGYFKDSPELLEAAARYIRLFP